MQCDPDLVLALSKTFLKAVSTGLSADVLGHQEMSEFTEPGIAFSR
jgi:hypothetical protein